MGSEIKRIVDDKSTIILDIEGTTTSISFVKEKLFPYAERFLESYVKKHWNDNEVKEIVDILIKEQGVLKENSGFLELPPLPSDESKIAEYQDTVIAHLKWQQSKDFKTTGLKRLQGYIWKDGYLNNLLVGHIYEDVPEALRYWKKIGTNIFIYSSGSIAAQKLLFSKSMYGNLDEFIDGNFDTTVGSKIEPESYLKIANEINEKPENIVFFTDRPKEVVAAKKSGMTVVRMLRDENNPFVMEEGEFLGEEDAVLETFSNVIEK